MTALAADRNTPLARGDIDAIPVKANAKIFAGSLVCRDANGWAVPGTTAVGLKGAGRAEERVDNTGGADGAVSVQVRRGVFRFANSGGADEITKAEVNQVCYVVDDQTVAKTSGGGTRSRAGFVTDVDGQGVWVLLGHGLLDAPAGTLLAANNLSDVAAAATARANIGANKLYLAIAAASLVGADAKVYRVVAPRAGTITKIRTVLGGALAVGNATLTAKIGAVAVTDGVVTITQAGSAAGDVDEATPSAANVVAAGDVISLTVGGTNTAAIGADALIEITF